MSLSEGPYLHIATWLDALGLCRMDAACRMLHRVNSGPAGPWLFVGERSFLGMELDVGGRLEQFDDSRAAKLWPALGRRDWKARCRFFHKEALSFSAPFAGSSITNVVHADEVVYCRCRLRSDILARNPDLGLYVEVEVLENADNLSLAIVDFEASGRSSVTFSPETGAVLRERKVRELPRAIEGSYLHLLPAASPARCFVGAMGLYFLDGHLAFFRRWRGVADADTSRSDTSPEAAEEQPWETTGFVTDLQWAQGHRLSVCLAFRDEGPYRVRIIRVGRRPPLKPERSELAYRGDSWSLLYGDDDHPLVI